MFWFVVFSGFGLLFLVVLVCFCVVVFLGHSTVTRALFVGALVACMAAYADADAVALARAAAVAFVAFVALAMAAWRTIAAAIIWSECAIRLRELFEQQHALMQCAQLAVNSRGEWLNE